MIKLAQAELFHPHFSYNMILHTPGISSMNFSLLTGINSELLLTNRIYVCETCRMVKNRNRNTAENLNKGGRAHPEPTNACGHDGSAHVSVRNTATSMNEAGSEDEQ